MVMEMSAKNFSHTHRLTMCGLKKLASRVFPEYWKDMGQNGGGGVVADVAMVETDQKQ